MLLVSDSLNLLDLKGLHDFFDEHCFLKLLVLCHHYYLYDQIPGAGESITCKVLLIVFAVDLLSNMCQVERETVHFLAEGSQVLHCDGADLTFVEDVSLLDLVVDAMQGLLLSFLDLSALVGFLLGTIRLVLVYLVIALTNILFVDIFSEE